MNVTCATPADLIGELTAHERRHAPDVLYLAGDVATLDAPHRISVVGSRRLSNEGAQRTRVLCRELARRDVVVVSGLAEGVDSIAHTTAMDAGGRTVAPSSARRSTTSSRARTWRCSGASRASTSRCRSSRAARACTAAPSRCETARWRC